MSKDEREHSDEAQLSEEEDEGLSNFLQLCDNFSDEDHIEELKWLKNFFTAQLENKYTHEKSELVPANLELDKKLKEDCFVKLLTYLDFEPPNDQQPYWRLKPYQTEKEILEKLEDDVQYIIHLQMDRCKQCKTKFKSIIQHLKKSANCNIVYSETEMADLKQVAQMRAKEKRTEWREKNKESLKSKEAERYQGQKKEMAEHYQQNREEILKKRSNDYDYDYDKDHDRKKRYYEKNKVAIAQKYQEKKAKILAEKKQQALEDRSRQLKEIKENFANEKSEIRKSAKHFKIYYSDLYLENIAKFRNKVLKKKRAVNFNENLSILSDLEKQIEAIYKDLDSKIEKIRVDDVAQMEDPVKIILINKNLNDYFNQRRDNVKNIVDCKLRAMACQINEPYNCPTCLMLRRFSTLGIVYCDECKVIVSKPSKYIHKLLLIQLASFCF